MGYCTSLVDVVEDASSKDLECGHIPDEVLQNIVGYSKRSYRDYDSVGIVDYLHSFEDTFKDESFVNYDGGIYSDSDVHQTIVELIYYVGSLEVNNYSSVCKSLFWSNSKVDVFYL